MKNAKENKVSNLEIYEKDLKKNYAIKGAVVGVALAAIPMGIAVANNVFGMNFRMDDATFVGDFVNNVYGAIGTLPGAVALGATMTAIGAAIGTDKAEEKARRAKQQVAYLTKIVFLI